MSTIDNINGIYAKDTELRNGISTLRNTVVNQTIKPLNVTKNGTYTADPTVGAYGYSPIIVDVQEEPWQPLEDGYSNFWFELTDDTLSPWLNFSAKNNNATIDWGDGSGEVALDTLTPTHTYSKAGKYVVKVKGVTGLAQQGSTNTLNGHYMSRLKYFELNNEITQINSDVFSYCCGIEKFSIDNVTSILARSFQFASSLYEIELKSVTVLYASSFYYCSSLSKVVLSSNIETIDNASFGYCRLLSEIHIQAVEPPELGSNVFAGLPNNFIVYVPVGYGETYKAASGWSTYADHILEEGQTPTRAMVAKFNSNNTDNEEMR